MQASSCRLILGTTRVAKQHDNLSRENGGRTLHMLWLTTCQCKRCIEMRLRCYLSHGVTTHANTTVAPCLYTRYPDDTHRQAFLTPLVIEDAKGRHGKGQLQGCPDSLEGRCSVECIPHALLKRDVTSLHACMDLVVVYGAFGQDQQTYSLPEPQA